MNKGIFITFEGADGCGKTTQAKNIAEYLTQKGLEVVLTRDPGGTPLGSRIREILLNHEGFVSNTCELLLYMADRAQHIEEKILPALEQGKIVICDRHIDSSLAYQGYARGLNMQTISYLNELTTQSKKPDLTIVFDVETDVAMTRVGDTKDRLESEAKDFHVKVRNGYLDIAKNNTDRVKIVNANNDIDTVFNDAIELIETLIR